MSHRASNVRITKPRNYHLEIEFEDFDYNRKSNTESLKT